MELQSKEYDRCTDDEEQVLLGIYAEADIQRELKTATWNKKVCTFIACPYVICQIYVIFPGPELVV